MDTNIIVVFHPFEVVQDVMVYQKGECVKQMHPTLNDTVGVINGLNEQYHADRINLCGAPAFVNRYVRELKTKFSNMPSIEIVPH